MTNIRLDVQGKRDAQIFVENLQKADPKEVERLINSYKYGNEPAWHRFIKGAYNHPITWWIGLLQIQMQLGILGHSRKVQAQIAANQLAQILNLAKDSVSKDILYDVLVYNLKNRKADILGRFAGGTFTNYASTGGRIGNKKLPKNANRVISLSNFTLASYGAAIKSVVTGHKKIEHVIQSILTGRPNGPTPYPSISGYKLSKEELELLKKAENSLIEMNALTDLSPAPVPVSEFCLRPENIDLKGLCK
ncbi:hypothetical protein [Pseudoalteromonas sp. 68 DY56-GL68]|uniref:hypothetical protein n=1 Tax=Pseudoalteromonas sp. 68 DY56-GL68 TaxID=2974919 RepID=UPI00352B4F01